MPLPVLVGKCLPAAVWTIEFAHVEHVSDLARYFDLLELTLAEWARRVPAQPLIQAAAADESLTVCTRCEVLQYVRADRTDELCKHFFELWPCIVNRKLLEFVSRDSCS